VRKVPGIISGADDYIKIAQTSPSPVDAEWLMCSLRNTGGCCWRFWRGWFEQKWGTKLAPRAGQLAADTASNEDDRQF
jgi:hypothetical protein